MIALTEDEMKNFIANHKGKLKNLFLVHGEFDTQKVWRNYLMNNGFSNIQIPEKGQIVEL